MRVIRNGGDWGSITVHAKGQRVEFDACGTLPKYGEILRVWGLRDGEQPLLIGVAEPDGDGGLRVRRTMSRQYLASLGYWPKLPERYAAGTDVSELWKKQEDPLLKKAMTDSAVTVREENGCTILTCAFSEDRAFPLAFAFCCCPVCDGRAQLVWDRKKGCPVWTAP